MWNVDKLSIRSFCKLTLQFLSFLHCGCTPDKVSQCPLKPCVTFLCCLCAKYKQSPAYEASQAFRISSSGFDPECRPPEVIGEQVPLLPFKDASLCINKIYNDQTIFKNRRPTDRCLPSLLWKYSQGKFNTASTQHIDLLQAVDFFVSPL